MVLCFFEHGQTGERWLNCCYKGREKCLLLRISASSLCVFHSLSFVFVLLQTRRMSAFLSATWTITSRHSHRRLMRWTWMRTPMLDLPSSLSAPTTGMKVGRVEDNLDVCGYEELTLSIPNSTSTLLQRLYSLSLQILFLLLCFVWPSFKKETGRNVRP